MRDPYAAAGILIYLVFVLVAIFADVIATHDPLEILFSEDGKLLAAAAAGRRRTCSAPPISAATSSRSSSSARAPRSTSG